MNACPMPTQITAPSIKDKIPSREMCGERVSCQLHVCRARQEKKQEEKRELAGLQSIRVAMKWMCAPRVQSSPRSDVTLANRENASRAQKIATR